MSHKSNAETYQILSNSLEKDGVSFDGTGYGLIDGGTANYGVAPDGYTTSFKGIPAATNTYKASYQQFSCASTRGTASIFVKASGYNFAVLESAPSVYNRAAITVNLTTGEMVRSYTVGTGTLERYSVQQYGNGWWRISVTCLAGSYDISYIVFTAVPDASYTVGGTNDPVFTGDGTSGVEFWGAQYETYPYVTSFISTGATTVFRGQDYLYTDLTNTALFRNNKEMSYLLELEKLHSVQYDGLIAVSADSGGQSYDGSILCIDGNLNAYGTYGGGGGGAVLYQNTIAGVGTTNKICMGFNTTDRFISVDGQNRVSATRTGAPQNSPVYGLYFGARTIQPPLMYIKEVSIYNKLLSAPEFRTLTLP